MQQPVVVVLHPVARMRRDVELVGALDEVEPLDDERHLAGAGQLDRLELLDVGVRAVAAHPFAVEDADAEDEVVHRLRRPDREPDRQPVAAAEDVRLGAVALDGDAFDAHRPGAPAAFRGPEHVGGRLPAGRRRPLRGGLGRLGRLGLDAHGRLGLAVRRGQGALLAPGDVGRVGVHHLARVAVAADAPRVHPHRFVAVALDHAQSVRHQHDGLAPPLEVRELVEALQAEPLVAHGQHLVDQQHVGVHVDGDGEAQPHVHARRVGLDRRIDEVLDLGELHDLVEPPGYLALRQPQHHAVDEDVLAPRDLRMEPGAQLDQGRDPPPHVDRAAGRLGDSRHQLEQGALARAVPADQPDRRARRRLQRHAVDRPEHLARFELAGQTPPEQRALERRELAAVRVPPVQFRHVAQRDRRLRHTSSANESRSRSKSA